MAVDPTTVPVQISMFGNFSVSANREAIHIRTRPAQSLLALLAIQAGRPISRTHLASNLWEELDFSVSGNRLRTTLVILKRAMMPWDSVKADRHSIWLESNSFESDFALASTLLKKARLVQDLDEELETYKQLLELIDRPLLTGFDEIWANSYREIWIGHRTASLLRVAQIHEEYGYLPESLASIEQVFEQDAFHPQAWIKYLRLMAKMDRSDEALRSLVSIQAKMKSEFGLEFDADVLAIANQVRHGAIRPSKDRHRFSAAEKSVLISAMETMATTAPDEFLGFLASKAFMSSIFQKPTAAFNIVVESMKNASDEIDLMVKGGAIRTAITAAFTLSYHDEREALCQMLIDQFPEDSEFFTSGMAQLSFLKFEQRDFVAATELAQRAIKLAQKHRPESHNRAVDSSLAACYWHCLRYEEAEAIYESLLADIAQKDDFVSRYNFALMSVNRGFLKSSLGDWKGCYRFSSLARQQASLHGFDAVISATGPLLGCSMIMLGLLGGPPLIIDGLKDNYRMRNTRVVEISLDYAACALVQLGDCGRGLAVLDAVTVLRNERLHARSLAEQELADRILNAAKGAVADGGIEVDASLLDVTMYACEALESFVG